MPQAKGLDNREILEEIRKIILEVAAIRILQSGDINVIVLTKAVKERAQSLILSNELKVYRYNYLIELLGVLLATRVIYSKQADNGGLATNIYEALKQLSLGLRITRIFQLYSNKQVYYIREVGKIRGSFIIGILTEEIRRTIIKGGIVINTQLFEARPFEIAFRKT